MRLHLEKETGVLIGERRFRALMKRKAIGRKNPAKRWIFLFLCKTKRVIDNSLRQRTYEV